MDVGNLPPALVRSGRIELWLETRLPDAQARAGILRDHCARLPAAIGGVDIDALATATEGLAGADLKRVVEDGKLLFAFDREKKGQTQSASTYFLQAVETVRGNKQLYAEAEARAQPAATRLLRPNERDCRDGDEPRHHWRRRRRRVCLVRNCSGVRDRCQHGSVDAWRRGPVLTEFSPS